MNLSPHGHLYLNAYRSASYSIFSISTSSYISSILINNKSTHHMTILFIIKLVPSVVEFSVLVVHAQVAVLALPMRIMDPVCMRAQPRQFCTPMPVVACYAHMLGIVLPVLVGALNHHRILLLLPLLLIPLIAQHIIQLNFDFFLFWLIRFDDIIYIIIWCCNACINGRLVDFSNGEWTRI